VRAGIERDAEHRCPRIGEVPGLRRSHEGVHRREDRRIRSAAASRAISVLTATLSVVCVVMPTNNFSDEFCSAIVPDCIACRTPYGNGDVMRHTQPFIR
jgi:hypothetical protein